MLNEILNHKIEYRDSLNLDPAITFGTEIEFAKLKLSKIDNVLKKENLKWDLKKDNSVTQLFFHWSLGGEISSPILTDNKETWIQLKKICHALKDLGAIETDLCGGHIHIGNQIIPKTIDSYINLFKLICIYEPILYRFGYGEYISYRSNAAQFAKPNRTRIRCLIKDIEAVECLKYEDLLLYLLNSKRYGINFHNEPNKQTIEFRMPNGTIEEVIWQNNINFYTSFLKYLTSAKFDPEFIDYKFKNYDKGNNQLFHYCDMCLNDAVELSNMLFIDEIDKMNFLTQYVKGAEENIRYRKTKNKFIK